MKRSFSFLFSIKLLFILYFYSKFFILPALLLLSFSSFSEVLKFNKVAEISNHPIWLKLLHVEKTTVKNQKKSLVKTSEFFLSKEGHINPASELEANLLAFIQPLPENPNLHARCKFPARFSWLRSQIPTLKNLNLPVSLCSDYMKWRGDSKIESVSVFFANGFFENPASFFGHSFIRLNVDSTNKSNNLFSMSLDYGAIIPEDEHPLIYITKGIFGGYEAGFSDGNYYQHHYDYGENQLRDLWEYKLNLSNTQKEKLLNHLWEVMPSKFTYYFTLRNCGSAMAGLIELLLPDLKLYRRGKPWVMPIELFQRLDQENENNKYFSQLTFHPSRQTKFYYNFNELTSNEKKAFKDKVKSKLDKFNQLSKASKVKVLEVLLDYHQLLLSKNYKVDFNKKAKKQILLERINYPAGKSINDKRGYINENPPHNAPSPSMLRIQVSEKNNKEVVKIRYRPVQFDLLGLEVARPQNSQLTVLDTSLEIVGGNVSLKNIDLLRIVSINESVTGLPGDRPISWGLHFAYGEHYLNCGQCNTFRAKGSVGKAIRLNSLLVGFGMFNVQAQTQLDELNLITISPSAGVIMDLNDRIKVFSQYALEFNNNEVIESIEFEARYQLSSNLDFRVDLNKHEGKELSMGFSYYW